MEVAIPRTVGGVGLRLWRPERLPSGALDYFTVELANPTIYATARIYAYGSEGLAAIFEQMACNWRGWSGAVEWQSMEGDFGLSCTSDRLGHVTVEVFLSDSVHWQVKATVRTEAGQLDAIAAAARRFFSVEG